ncbi:MAG TPA: hypothetical protein VLJ39_20430 [Tepidisphaeraceae bacterium]|nr:hypothetical protein [Tepidisphaeraceae bacterium]
MSDSLPGEGFFGWLGRQVGHIKKAVHTDPAGPKVTYRKENVEEVDHPQDPGVKLRRTTIDEVIVQKELPQKTPPKSPNIGEKA